MEQHNAKPQKSYGLVRLWRAFFYSLAGLRSALYQEAAFRQEILLTALLLPILLFIPIPASLKWLILMAHVLVLVTELLNSAVEAVVDLVSPEYHELAKRAKDLGSAAVLLTVVMAACLWGYALYLLFF